MYLTWCDGKEDCFFEELWIGAFTKHQFLVFQIIEVALIVQGTKPLLI